MRISRGKFHSFRTGQDSRTTIFGRGAEKYQPSD
jgi:hypothetical protein